MKSVVSVNELRTDFDNQVNSRGQIFRIKRYTEVIGGGGSYYDDDVALTHMTGSDTWSSGLVQNVGTASPFKSNEAFLLEQGKLLAGDKKIYVAGSHDFSGAAFKIGLGSPPTDEYRVIDDGIIAYPLMGSNIYQKLFIRILTNGSLTGE